MFQLKLVPNREDRPRYVTLIKYEERWQPVGDGTEILTVHPLRRTFEWVRSPDGEFESFVCTRVTELPWRAIKPQQAHRELIQQWKDHLSRIVLAAKAVAVEVVP